MTITTLIFIAAAVICSLTFDAVPIVIGSGIGIAAGAALAVWIPVERIDDGEGKTREKLQS